MLSYIFFDDELRDRFTGFLKERGVAYSESPDPLGQAAVAIAEDLDDDLYDAIEGHYDELSQLQERRLQGTGDRLEMNRAGIRVTLGDGRPCMVRLDADLVSRLLTVLSLDELQELVTIAARSGADPDDRPVCQDP